MAKKESDIEAYLNFKVKNKGGLSIKLLPFNFNGLPDRLVIIPKGIIYFIELKKPGGVVSAIQKYVHNEFKKRGVHVYIISSKKEIDELLNKNY